MANKSPVKVEMAKTRKQARKTHYDFIEIGTSDFNTLIQKATPSTVGLSVEPLKDYLDRLPTKPHVQKVNAAVSKRSGSIDLYYVPDAVRIEKGLPSWMKGTNSIGAPHPTVVRYLEKHGLPQSIVNAYLDLAARHPALLAKKILFESNALANKTEVTALRIRLSDLGYTVTVKRQDTVAILN